MAKFPWYEYPQLFCLNFVVKIRNLIEHCRVIKRYYPNPTFKKVDRTLLGKYFFRSPFAISKDFLIQKGESDIYAYGETPLTTLEMISKECELNSRDVVYELGCGRGRGCFWLHCFIGCRMVGIEYIPDFVDIADSIRDRFALQNIEFRLGDILKGKYAEATVIYLYGTCYEDQFINKLLKRFSKLPKGKKIITVSFPLTDYSSNFEVIKQFSAPFTWGHGDVYLHVKL